MCSAAKRSEKNAQKNIHANPESPRLQQHIARRSLTEIMESHLERGEWMAYARLYDAGNC